MYEELRKSTEKANLYIDSFEYIDKALTMLSEMDQLITDLTQIVIQDAKSIKNAILLDYHIYFEKEREIKKYIMNNDEIYDEVIKTLSVKYVMPEEVIDAIIDKG